MDEEEKFTSNDGLLLVAISCSRKISMVNWIHTIDYLDRSSMSFTEMKQSLERLQKSGMILYNKNKFKLSPLAKNILKGGFFKYPIPWQIEVRERIEQITYCEVENLKSRKKNTIRQWKNLINGGKKD